VRSELELGSLTTTWSVDRGIDSSDFSTGDVSMLLSAGFKLFVVS